MAKAILVYAMLVAPLMWFVGLFTFETLPKHEEAAFIEGAFNVLSSAGDFVLVLVLAIGGWRLRGLHPAAPGWLKGALWLHLGFFAVALAVQIRVVMVVDELVPDAPIPSLGVRDGLLLALALAARAFEIGALAWLHRQAALMKSLCQPPPLRKGPHGTMVLGPGGAAEAGGVPKWSRTSIVGAALTALSLPAPVLLAVLLLTSMGDIGPWEVGLAFVSALLLGLPGTVLGWVGLSDVRAYPKQLRGMPLALFAALAWPLFLLGLSALVGNVAGPWPRTTPAPEAGGPGLPQRAVVVKLSAPPRETLVVTGIVLSNGVPVSGRELRAKLWPPSGRDPSPFEVRWQVVENSAADGPPWEFVVEDKTSGTTAARLQPSGLPDLDWTISPAAVQGMSHTVTREAHTFEVARALQAAGGGRAGAADWSLRLRLQSSPAPPSTSKRGVEADFVLPANQVATFEVVTRSNGVVVPVPELAAYHINGTPGTCTGKFILADDPDELDGLTGLPRWTFGVIGPDGRLTSQGLAVPPIPESLTGQMSLWKELQPDSETVEGQLDSGSSRPTYGLRIRTRSVGLKPGLHHTASGFGTNWMKDAAQHLGSANPNPATWIRFTFTAVELREVGGTRWLAVDYVDDVHGACSKAFPWECTLPGAKPEIRTSEFLKDDPGSPAVRHQRIEYRMPDSVSREQLDRWRAGFEKTLKQKSVQLGLGEKCLLFGVSTTEGFSINAWVEVKPPLPESP